MSLAMDLMQTLAQLGRLDRQLGELLGAAIANHGEAIYLLLFAVVFLEIGVAPLFFLPGDPLLFFCGAFCAGGALQLGLLMPLLFVAALGGGMLAYALGRGLGLRARARPPRWLDPQALARAHGFFERHGRLTLWISPYVAVMRTFAPLAAGVALMAPRRFLLAAAGGALAWVAGLLMAGYYFGQVPLLRDHIGAIALLGLVLGLGSIAWRRWRERR